MKFMLRRLRKSHGFKCRHLNTDFLLNKGANYLLEECNDCNQIIRKLGWDDLRPKSRESILAQLEEKKANEAGD